MSYRLKIYRRDVGGRTFSLQETVEQEDMVLRWIPTSGGTYAYLWSRTDLLGEEVLIPSVIGLQQEEASARLSAFGLGNLVPQILVVDEITGEVTGQNTVATQVPEPKTWSPVGTVAALMVAGAG